MTCRNISLIISWSSRGREGGEREEEKGKGVE